mgnify:CR=1 FL=1
MTYPPPAPHWFQQTQTEPVGGEPRRSPRTRSRKLSDSELGVDNPGTFGQRFFMTKEVDIEQVASELLNAAFRVHTSLGPGLLESAYEACMEHVLRQKGFRVARQVTVPIEFDGLKLDAGYRMDLLVEDLVVAELKAVDALLPIHHAQVLTQLKLSRRTLGFLINFNVTHLRDGIKRIVLGHPRN